MLVNGFIGTRYGDRKGETYLAALQILGSSRWPAEGAMVMFQRWNSALKMVEKRERMPDDAGVHGYTPLSLRLRPETPQWLCDATLVTKKISVFPVCFVCFV